MLSEDLLQELATIVGPGQVHAGPAQLITYSYDGTFQQHVPDIAGRPRLTRTAVRS